MKHIIIGAGEVGKSLYEVLSDDYFVKSGLGTSKTLKKDEVLLVDANPTLSKCDYLHICFPWSKSFKKDVSRYMEQTRAKIVIVHSSVPVGICDSMQIVHSPIRGVHPHLTKGIETFVKYFGGRGAKQAAKQFSKHGIKTKSYAWAKITEAGKIWDTTAYGLMIVLEKEIFAWCRKNKVPFDIVYTEFTNTYNKGYEELGIGNVVRPILKHMPGKIGGHCILPNAKILNSSIAKTVLNYNKHF